jgi:hypothetical protein
MPAHDNPFSIYYQRVNGALQHCWQAGLLMGLHTEAGQCARHLRMLKYSSNWRQKGH